MSKSFPPTFEMTRASNWSIPVLKVIGAGKAAAYIIMEVIHNYCT